MKERLTTDKQKIFARENPTLMSMTKDELRQHYNEIFDRLQEYETAEENGDIIIPPCKVGDTAYILGGEYRGIYEVKVRVFFFNHKGIEMIRTTDCDIPFKDVGKVLFFDREAAEQAAEKKE